MVSRAEDDSMDTGECSAVFEHDVARYRIQSSIDVARWRICRYGRFESQDFTTDADGAWREERGGEVESAASGDLVDLVGLGGDLAGDVGGGDAGADQEDVLLWRFRGQ